MDITSHTGNSGGSLIIDVDKFSRFVSTEMIRVGFIPSLKGFKYFKELLILSVCEKQTDNLMTMYANAAERLGSKSTVLERNVRTLVTSSFYNGIGFRPLSNYFGLQADEHPPTVGQILALMTEFIETRIVEIGDNGLNVLTDEKDHDKD